MKGQIIVIEGIDGSGKNTQANHILKYAKGLGLKVEKMSFPAYDETFFGKEVGSYLNGEFGGIDQIHPKLSAMLYAGDRFEKKDYIEKRLEEGYLLIMDRYVPSNVVHQAAKAEGADRASLACWIEKLEYQVYGMPEPDAVIFLDVPPETSQELILAKDTRTYTDKKQDLHEENKPYLEKVYDYFYETASVKGWSHIRCFKDGYMRSELDIFNDLIKSISSMLP